MTDSHTAEKRFPELSQFELEMEVASGWTTVRASEDERAACILENHSAVESMMCGAYRYVERAGVKTRFRLTPKAWLEKKHV